MTAFRKSYQVDIKKKPNKKQIQHLLWVKPQSLNNKGSCLPFFMSHTHIYFNDRETYSWLRSTIGKFLRTNSASWLSWNVELPVGTQIALVAPSSFFFWSLIHDGNGKFYIPDENVKQKWQATRINNSSRPTCEQNSMANCSSSAQNKSLYYLVPREKFRDFFS